MPETLVANASSVQMRLSTGDAISGTVDQLWDLIGNVDASVMTDSPQINIDGSTLHFGIGPVAPTDGLLHVQESSAGTVTANAVGDLLVLESGASGGNGLSILTPDTTSNGYIMFGDASNNDQGVIRFSHAANSFVFEENSIPIMHLASVSGVIVNNSNNNFNFAVKGTTSDTLFVVDANLNTNGGVGISNAGLNPTDGLLHIQSGSAGAVAANGNANELVLEGSGNAGISILGGATSIGNIYFGSTAAGGANPGRIQYDYNSDVLYFSANSVEVLRLRTDQGAIFNESGVATQDFRVESDLNTHMFFVDAGNNSVHIDNSLLTGAGDGDLVMANSKAIRWINVAGSTSANFGITGNNGNNIFHDVPAEANSHVFSWAGLNRGRIVSENSGMGIRFDAEASADHSAPAANGAVLYTKDVSGDTKLFFRSSSEIIQLGAGGGDSLPVADTTSIVKGSADATKLLRFEVDGNTTGTTRVLTTPDFDLDLGSLPNGYYNVLDYGATGDGVTDDTAAIQAAVDAINALSRPGGTLFFPVYSGVGTYILTDEINFGNTQGIRIDTNGGNRINDGTVSNLHYGATIKCSGVNKNFFNFGETATSVSGGGPVIKNLNFIGDDITVVGTSNISFNDNGVSDDTIVAVGVNWVSSGFTSGMVISCRDFENGLTNEGDYTITSFSTTSTTNDTIHVATGSFSSSEANTSARISNKSAFISIRAINNGFIENCSFVSLHMGVNMDSGQPTISGGDNSWYQFNHCRFRNVDIGIGAPDRASGVQGSHEISGGNFLVRKGGCGVYISDSSPQVRVHDMKMDGDSLTGVGVIVRGYNAIVHAINFEAFHTCVKVESPGPHSSSGKQNNIYGNVFSPSTYGLRLDSGTEQNNAYGNAYAGLTTTVDNLGSNNIDDLRHKDDGYDNELVGPNAIPLNFRNTLLRATGAGDNFTLADGRHGQEIKLMFSRDVTNLWVKVTPTNLKNGTHITMRAQSDYVILRFTITNWDTGSWAMIGGTGQVVGQRAKEISSGFVESTTTEVATTAVTTEETLFTKTIEAYTLAEDGNAVRVTAYGTTASNANGKTVRLKWNNTAILFSAAETANNKPWKLEALIVRDDINGVKVIASGVMNDVLLSKYTFVSANLSTDRNITVTGQNSVATAGDIQLEGVSVEYIQMHG